MSLSTLPHTVVGPRKRRPSERVTQNGDPLSRKKVKISTAESQKSDNRVSTKKVAPKGAHVDRHASVEDVAEPPPSARSQPRDPNRILEASDGSDDDHDDDIFIDMPELEVPEDDDDSDSDDDEPVLIDDVSELGRCFVKACSLY